LGSGRSSQTHAKPFGFPFHHEEGEAILSFLRTGKGQRDSSDVGLRRHS